MNRSLWLSSNGPTLELRMNCELLQMKYSQSISSPQYTNFINIVGTVAQQCNKVMRTTLNSSPSNYLPLYSGTIFKV
jgi:hypothetical protein